MKLTGQCKEDFEKWRSEKYQECDLELSHDIFPFNWLLFNTVPFEMQYGVLVDFFDSVGLNIYVSPGRYGEYYSTKNMQDYHARVLEKRFNFIHEIGVFNKSHEAREEAIKAANNLYNNK